MRSEFSWTPEEASAARSSAALAGELLTDMHEVIGHASGQQAAGFKGTPQEAIKEHFSALEEGRADLVGLYFLAGPEARGARHRARRRPGRRSCAPSTRPTRATRSCSCGACARARRSKKTTCATARWSFGWLMANTKAIEQRTRDGKTYLRDGRRRRHSATASANCSPRFSGSSRRATTRRPRRCSTRYGIHFDADAARRGRRARGQAESALLPGFVMPKLTAVTGRRRHDHRRDDFVPAWT